MTRRSVGGILSPTSEKVSKLTDEQLQEAMVELTGEKKPWTTCWNAAHELADRFDLLQYPRYYAKTRVGNWAIKESHTPPLAVAKTGPLAICKAILTLKWGKGQDYSPHRKG